MKHIFIPYIIDYPSSIIVDTNTSNKLTMKVLKSRYSKATVNGDNFLTIKNYSTGSFVKLKNPTENYLGYKDHAFIVIYNSTDNKRYIPYKILNLTLKEQTGYNYCMYVYSHEIEEDKKTERVYKLKTILNGKTNIQKQRESTIHNRERRTLALPISCD